MFKRVSISSLVVVGLVSTSAFAGHHSYKGEGMVMKDQVVAKDPVVYSAFRPYVGLNATYLHESYKNSVTENLGGTDYTFDPNKTMANNFWGWSMDAGFRYGQYVGMEWGYASYDKKSKSSGTTTTKIHPKAAYMDFRGYYPIEQVDLIAMVGVAITALGDAQVTDTALTSTSTLQADDSVLPRIGLGVAYNFNENWGVRAEAKYTFTTSRYIDNAYTIDAGIYYNFTV